MATNSLDRVLKMLLNRRVTSEGKRYFEEFGDSTLNVHATEIWSTTIDEDPAIAVVDSVVQEYNLLELSEDITVANQASWYAYGINSQTLEIERLKDWVSDKYGSEYGVKLYDAEDNQIFPTDAAEWFFDYQTGILTFSGDIGSFATPFKISGYRYIGTKGVGSGEGGVVDGVVSINLFPEKSTPYNKTIQYEMPALEGTYEVLFDLSTMPIVAGKEVELASYSFACSGYGDGDFLNVYINDTIIEDTWYTREIPEESSIGNGVAVYSIPIDSEIKVQFHNDSATSKILWFKIKLLYNP